MLSSVFSIQFSVRRVYLYFALAHDLSPSRSFRPQIQQYKLIITESARALESNIRWKSTSREIVEPYESMHDKNKRQVPDGRRDDTCDRGLSRRSLRVKPPAHKGFYKSDYEKKTTSWYYS